MEKIVILVPEGYYEDKRRHTVLNAEAGPYQALKKMTFVIIFPAVSDLALELFFF